MKKKKIMYSSLFLIFLIFFISYAYLIFSLPLFGDATTHAKQAKEIIEKGILDSKDINYPPYYSILQATLFEFFGENGFNLVILLGIVLLTLSIFLITRELKILPIWIGLLIPIFILSSPKIIFYSSRMYMEILLSSFFILTVFLFIKFLKKQNNSNFFLLCFFISISTIVKQLGVVVLLPSILIFLALLKNPKIKLFKNLATLFIFILLITLPFYLILFHSDGSINGEDYDPIFKKINDVGKSLVSYSTDQSKSNFNLKWNNTFKEIDIKYYKLGIANAINNTLYPFEPLISIADFSRINGLYLKKFAQGSTKPDFDVFTNTFLIIGIILVFINWKKLEKEKRNFALLILIISILAYITFVRATDLMRYHLYLPILMSFFFFMNLFYLDKSEKENSRLFVKLLQIFIIFVMIILLFTIFSADLKFNLRWSHTQIYSSSIGGIPSIIEAGRWLNQNLNSEEIFWLNCGNELGYYADRDYADRFEFYFLNDSELKEAFSDLNIKYVILLDSVIVNDTDWKNFCLIPSSFSDRINKIYSLSYKTSFGDIRIYKVT